MKKNRKKIIAAAAAVVCLVGPVSAGAEAQPEYSFDPVVITALRSQTKDLNTPAYVHVIKKEQLEKTGTNNLLDALQFIEGVTYDGYGAAGHLYSSMASHATIRGMDRGTLILVNGVPTNMSGYYALERIPFENIEKVEVVKGASSVLYGSSALGGVINIITKDTVKNSFSIEAGKYDRHAEDLSLQIGKLAVSARHSEQGDVGAISAPYSGKHSAYRGDERDLLRWTYVFDKNISLTHQRDVDDFRYDRMNSSSNTLYERIDQKETKDLISLKVKHGIWQSNIYKNILDRDYKKHNASNSVTADTDTKFTSLGADSQTTWRTPFGEYIGGWTWMRETFKADDYHGTSAYVPQKERDSYSVFMQVKHPTAKNQDLIIGARQEFISQQEANDYNEFCPQLQLVTRLSEDKSWYVNVSRAFRMPNLSDMYGSTWRKTSNPNLDPEYGYNYEIGWKLAKKDYALKFAVFHMDFTNYIHWKEYPAGSNTYVPYNTKFRNTGVEVSYDRKLNKIWDYTLGVSYGNPEEYVEDPSTTPEWSQIFPRLQLTGGVNYHLDKWKASLRASYMANRMDNRKPALPVNMTVGYQLDQDKSLELRVENLLNRKDIVSHGSSLYYSLPRSYMLKYKVNF